MHKWFARRTSSVFRAILLGAMKPAGTNIMDEFYKNHSNDPDTKGKVVLDPFMGGGTTIVESLRLGCRVVGVDLNPVAWFIVRTEAEAADLKELQASFVRLTEHKVGWSGKSLKETLLDLYKTQCPACGNADADIIYTFWVKSAPCTTAICDHLTPLFSEFLVTQKKPSIRYFADCSCPQCKKKFDWDREPATFVGEERLMVNSGKFSAGEGRTNTRWAYSEGNTVNCPWCIETVQPVLQKTKKERKKVTLSVFYCPSCEEVWQFRGELEGKVKCPSCNHDYDPMEGNFPEDGKFICRGKCNGNLDSVINAIRKLKETERFTARPYAMEGWCPKCGGQSSGRKVQDDLFGAEDKDEDEYDAPVDSTSILRKNKGKFIKRITAADYSNYKEASRVWGKEKAKLPHPQSEIPVGEKTKSGLHAHHYFYWNQMFNDRQLLALSTLLDAIKKESKQKYRDFLLLAFSHTLDANNEFTRNRAKRNTPGGTAPGGIFSRHDFQSKSTFCEQNVFGTISGYKTFLNCWDLVTDGKKHNLEPYDRMIKDGKQIELRSGEGIEATKQDMLLSQSSKELPVSVQADFVITDPPYADNVNYSELSDFFYVWLRLILKDDHKHFQPEYTPKAEEIIENPTRGKTTEDFQKGLQGVFEECKRHSKEDALLVFTFHHSEGAAWEALLNAVCEAGFCVEAVYPVQSEAESSMHLQGNEAISYDLIHVCRKRPVESEVERRSWAGIRQEIRRKAREEATVIQGGRYGNEPLSPADANILLIGKCLELYSRHYGAVVDHEDKPVPLRKALEEIKMMVDQIVTKEDPLPTELADIDIPSYIYFTSLCNRREISGDDLSKSTRGIVETSVLRDCGLLVKGRQKGGRTFEVKRPGERLNDLKSAFKNGMDDKQGDMFGEVVQAVLPKGTIFADCIQLLLGLSESGENLLPWLEKFRGMRPQVRAAMEYMAKRNKNFAPSAQKVLALIDEKTLFGS